MILWEGGHVRLELMYESASKQWLQENPSGPENDAWKSICIIQDPIKWQNSRGMCVRAECIMISLIKHWAILNSDEFPNQVNESFGAQHTIDLHLKSRTAKKKKPYRRDTTFKGRVRMKWVITIS